MTTSITVNPYPQNTSPAQNGKAKAPDIVNNDFFGSFGDFLDVINPLHHIPVVSSIYESLTGDTQSTGAKLAGGALFGGPIGFLASLFDSIVEGESGKGVGGHMMAAVNSAEETQVASNDSASYAYPTSAYLKTAALL
ncbi:MAG: hypothetical protein EBR02_04575 [Alphaproteobacteria bacterium]|nr:hypothetical protein [Alphaproteobacteria bacterium]